MCCHHWNARFTIILTRVFDTGSEFMRVQSLSILDCSSNDHNRWLLHRYPRLFYHLICIIGCQTGANLTHKWFMTSLWMIFRNSIVANIGSANCLLRTPSLRLGTLL
ncbi:hypothetical protein FOQG_05232 [Fusarium oxysporum f. sp. raphani 54005]|uniref:Uncharacterized protein n=4 Tax=Fusarium oxysporum TaxID=5507 RepID=X0CQ62_FUSOX|nr:hypothetical protein FOVG_10872 [Fusarium oxysporum f. sp. pisi HDV247]EXK92994.1 hypothetical protein FOQG_05232 [Fusarium oxysporum f. sp. raphani 54005]EXL82895.1 hypothetical protein FOPG_04320 [Fusarium oxysporum f. sp. conglutinans race 2 54008]EXM26544.1 hypothetical protein FOTG_06839 [Fusarium oxysporum f. sp. vasinfectum 25433]